MSEDITLQDRIAVLFLKEMNLEVPSPDTDLFETGVLDSLAFVDLMLHLEQEFGVTISVESLELDNFRSIARIAGFIAHHTHHGDNHLSEKGAR